MFPRVLSEHCMRHVARGPPYVPASLAEIGQILIEINLVLFINESHQLAMRGMEKEQYKQT